MIEGKPHPHPPTTQMGAGAIITVSNQHRNASAQLINLGDNAGGGSRCGDTDVFPLQDTTRKQMIHVSPLLKSGAGPQWRPRRQSHNGVGGGLLWFMYNHKLHPFSGLVGNVVRRGLAVGGGGSWWCVLAGKTIPFHPFYTSIITFWQSEHTPRRTLALFS